MARPIAVIAGDIHYSLSTLELADAGTRQAIAKANELMVPFIANGDTHDTKANLRGECVNAMIAAFKTAKIKPYVNIGNHCKINEKSQEHSLNFLKPYASVIEAPTFVEELDSYIIPYQHDLDVLLPYLQTLPSGSRVIMHQGVQNALSGEYIQDKSAVPKEALADFRAILSHYHARQDIKCGRPRKGAVGLASYVGNLYTLNYAEANDPPKGFQILMDDGTLEFVPTNLRKHVVLEAKIHDPELLHPGLAPGDLVWLKLHGTKEQITTFNKKQIQDFFPSCAVRLDLIPTDSAIEASSGLKKLSGGELVDSIIDQLSATEEGRIARLKAKWRQLCE